jgi:hypothetical protein
LACVHFRLDCSPALSSSPCCQGLPHKLRYVHLHPEGAASASPPSYLDGADPAPPRPHTAPGRRRPVSRVLEHNHPYCATCAATVGCARRGASDPRLRPAPGHWCWCGGWVTGYPLSRGRKRWCASVRHRGMQHASSGASSLWLVARCSLPQDLGTTSPLALQHQLMQRSLDSLDLPPITAPEGRTRRVLPHQTPLGRRRFDSCKEEDPSVAASKEEEGAHVE